VLCSGAWDLYGDPVSQPLAYHDINLVRFEDPVSRWFGPRTHAIRNSAAVSFLDLQNRAMNGGHDLVLCAALRRWAHSVPPLRLKGLLNLIQRDSGV
jgi:hypothetical protein